MAAASEAQLQVPVGYEIQHSNSPVRGRTSDVIPSTSHTLRNTERVMLNMTPSFIGAAWKSEKSEIELVNET